MRKPGRKTRLKSAAGGAVVAAAQARNRATRTQPRREAKRKARPLLVLSAWEPELARLRLVLAERPELRGKVELKAVGIGLVEAGIGAAQILGAVEPAVAIFVGTAGLYPAVRTKRRLSIGGVAAVSSAALVSVASTEGRGYFPGPLPSQLGLDRKLLDELRAAAGDLPVATVGCPLAITSHRSTARTIAEKTGSALENLELFAVGRAAALAGVPFAAVLGISNETGPSAHEEWRKFGNAAAAAACDAVVAYLDRALARR